ncbi:MAG TPA: glycosyltransferase family 39 protein [Bryobacteraceae bacterium]|nr:glycosyltransferase family 39 protein [Bryobacteraceae bacterium]
MFRSPAPLWVAVAAVAVFLLLLWNLDGAGLLGPDEPRYASIGRDMARSGDWITPRLWGEPWFEKPPLLYWMTAAGFTLGLGPEAAPRLPVALLSAGFLAVFFIVLRREFGARAAAYATAALGTSAAWIAYSRVAVTDLPLAATFSAFLLLCVPWIARGEKRQLPVAGAMLGLAVLAKGLVPLVLALPLIWFARKRWRDAVIPALVGIAVAAPWYVLVTLRHGRAFINEFFLEHHFGRFATEALRHEQPFWFYLPVLLAGLFPWIAAAPLAVRTRGDVRRRVLLAVVFFGFVFFSASRNKLPGYLLPLVPAAAALIGISLAELRRPRWVLAACAATLGILPLIATILPAALERGITHAPLAGAAWAAAIPALALAAAIALTGKRDAAVAGIVAGMAVGVVWTASQVFPALDRTVSARAFWNEAASKRALTCVGQTHRSWRYNLNYYSGTPLPACEEAARPFRIEQSTRQGPRVVEN